MPMIRFKILFYSGFVTLVALSPRLGIRRIDCLEQCVTTGYVNGGRLWIANRPQAGGVRERSNCSIS